MKPHAVVTFLNVGWGDAHLIRLPSGLTTLIDGGDGSPTAGASGRPLDWMDRHGVNRLDWMILTHIHEDHLNGLIDIARHREVARAVLPYELPSFAADAKESMTSPLAARVLGMLSAYAELIRLLTEQRTDIRWRARYGADSHSVLWEEDGYALAHLYPWQDDPLPGLETLTAVAARLREGDDANECLTDIEAFFALSNDDSSVYRLTYAEEPFEGVLFGGDQLKDGWGRIARRTNLKSKVLKAPHHGLEDGLDAELLAVVDPAACVVPICRERSLPLRERWDRLRAGSGASFRLTGDIVPGDRERLTDGPIETWIDC